MDILDLKPDYMSLLIGANDIFRDQLSCGGHRADRFKRDYENLIEAILPELPDIKLILMSPFILPTQSFYEKYRNHSGHKIIAREWFRLFEQVR